jgi:hypothetical protein
MMIHHQHHQQLMIHKNFAKRIFYKGNFFVFSSKYYPHLFYVLVKKNILIYMGVFLLIVMKEKEDIS